jgi:LysM repeat protein
MFRATSAAPPSTSTDPAGAGPTAGKRTATERLRSPSAPAAPLGVTVHQDGQAEALGTRAFARGEHLHLAAGTLTPGSPTAHAVLAHELGHVEQQREGRVAATEWHGGVAVNRDPALEADADRRGAAIAAAIDLDAAFDFTDAGASAAADPGTAVVQGLDLPASPPTVAATSASTHVVGAGETVPRIAARFGVTVEALLAANPAQVITIPGTSGPVRCFRAGDTIVIPAAASPASPPAAPAAAPTDAPAPPATDEAAPDLVTPAPPAPVGGAAGALAALGGLFTTVTDALDAAFGWLLGPDGEPIPSTEVAPEAPGLLAPMPAPDLAGGAGPAAPVAELSPAERGARLSTMSPEDAADVDEFGFSADGKAAAIADGRWLVAKDLSTAIRGKSGDAFLSAADGVVASRAFVEDQQAVIAAARAFAASPQPLEPAQEANAAIPWDQATTSLDGNVLDAELRVRLERFMRFVAWAGLVDGPIAKVGALRSPADAHQLSVAWMFNTGTNTTSPSSLHKATNRRALADTLAARGGADDRDTWLAPATVAEVVARRDDDAALRTYLFDVAAPEARQVRFQSARAAEGYADAARRHPNVWPGTGVSMHPGGLAVDLFPAWTLSNLFDPLIDAMALYFGLVRTVKDDANSPEHWHYERVGTPPAPETE